MILAQATGLSFSWDLNTATLLAVGANFVAIIWSLFKTHSTANSALKCAEEAKADIEKLGLQFSALAGNHALLREQVARDHPDRNALGEVEARLTGEIHMLRKSIEDFIRSQSPNNRR